MKRKILRAIVLAMAWCATVSTTAANYQINVPASPAIASECLWTYGTTYPTKQIAVSNGVVYGILPAQDPGIAYYNTTNGEFGTINTGTADNGYPIATDDNKNIVIAINIPYNADEKKPIATLRVIKATTSFGVVNNGAQYKDISISNVLSGITTFTQFFSASGNLWDGVGYLYLTDGSNAVRITIENGQATKQHVVPLTGVANATSPMEDFIKIQPNGKFLLNSRTSGEASDPTLIIPDCTIDWENGTFSAGATTYNYMQAPALTVFKDHEIFVHPSATRNTTTSHELFVNIDRSAQYTLDSHPVNSSASKGNYGCFNAWAEFEQVDDNTLGLYVFSPYYTYTADTDYSCVSRYNITATKISGEYIVSSAPVWTKAATGATSSYPLRFQQPALSPSGLVYFAGGNSTNAPGSTTVRGAYVYGDALATTVSCGYATQGFGAAFDDNNHYIFHGGGTGQSYDAAPTAVVVRRPSDDGTGSLTKALEAGSTYTASSQINLGSYAPGIVAKFFDATGDMATTGHLWWVGNETYTDQAYVIRGVTINNFAATEKIQVSVKALHGLNASSTGNNYIQFYDTSDPTSYCALLQLHGNGLYDVVIDITQPDGYTDETVYPGRQINAVSCTKIPDSSIANYSVTGAHIFMLNDHKFLTRAVEMATDETTHPTKFEIVDITDINNPVIVATIQPTYGNNVSGGPSHIGTWVQTRKISDNVVEIYAFAPTCGVEVYTFTANIDNAATMSAINGTIKVSELPESHNRQDAVLTWTAPAGYDIAEYQVYVKEEYYTTAWNYTVDETYLAGTTTTNSFTFEDMHWIKGSSDWYKQSYTFYVTPILADDAGMGPTKTITMTPDFLACPPVWDHIKHYDGFQKVQLYWTAPTWGHAPNYYDVYRNGIKINDAPIMNYNYLDASAPAGEVTYYVKGYYLEDQSEVVTSAVSNRTPDKVVTVTRRDPMKTTYTIEEIYNYRIGSGTNEVKPTGVYSTLTNNLRYKQGKYYKGYWYLMQQNNNTIDYSRVMRFNADKEKILTETATAVITEDITGTSTHYSTAGWSVGLAMDDAGNIFTRRYGVNEAGTSYVTGSRLRYYFELGAGAIYLRNADGSYQSTPIIVDLSQCQLFDHATQWSKFEPINNIYYGRVEYFNMTGDLTPIGGVAYLWVSASSSKRSNKIKLTRTNASTITATLVEKVDITLTERVTGEDFAVGVENYVFPVKYLKNNNGVYTEEYRGDYIHNLRSRVYANIKPTDNPNDITDEQGTIYDTQSRVNQCGGTTIGWNNEIFMITPQCPHSQNSGNFYVAMGDRAIFDAEGNPTYDAEGNLLMYGPENADLTMPIPVAQFTQDEITDGSFSNSNGNWIDAVLGKVENEDELGIDFTDPGEADCVYIYQYIPGVRFAKYRLVPNNYFPPTPVDLAISSTYVQSENNPTNDLVSYDGVAQFGIAVDGGSTTQGNVNFKIDYYTYTMQDEAGTDVWTYTVKPDGSYTYTRVKDGVTTTGSGNGAYTAETYTDIDNVEHSGYFTFTHPDLVRGTVYKSTVEVNYVNTSDATDTHKSEVTIDYDTRDYTAYKPSGSVTVAQSDMTDHGEAIDVYRVEINVNPPATVEEPVSYYVITATKPDGSTVTIDNFDLMINGEPQPGGESDVVPGDYDFEANEGAVISGESTQESTLVWYDVVPDGTYTNGTDDPSTWKYTITAVYADEATTYSNLQDNAESDLITATSITTGIEDVAGGNSLRLYPVPVADRLTIESPEALKLVEVYNNAGVVVIAIACNGETTTTVDVENLAPGYYFVKINNQEPVKIVKL